MISLRDALAPVAAKFGRPIKEHEVLRISGTILGPNFNEGAIAARKEVLTWAKKRAGGVLPAEAWKFAGYQHLAGGRNSTGVRLETERVDIWAVRSEDPDKNVPGRVWTTEVVVGGSLNSMPQFNARLLVNTSEDFLHIEPHAPGFVQQIADKVGVQSGPIQISSEPHFIDSDEELEYLVDLLLSPDRKIPIFVLSEGIFSNGVEYMADAGSLSRAVLGMAHVVLLPEKYTWSLSDRLGKTRSVFGGAVRAYMPGFSEGADPFKHRLMAPKGNYTEDSVRCTHWLRTLAAEESVKRTTLGRDILPFLAIRNASLQMQQREFVASGASETDQLRIAKDQITALEMQLEEADSYLTAFSDAQKIEEERALTAEEQLRASNFRIQQLLTQLKGRGDEPDTNIVLPEAWQEFANWCDTHLAGRVVLTPLARRGVKGALFSDVMQAAKCLIWLANECRDSLLGLTDLITSEATVSEGIKNAHCGSDVFDFDWQGKRFTADWHVKNGGNTRSPERCLRIYYYWDEITQQIIVADMPAHRRSDAS